VYVCVCMETSEADTLTPDNILQQHVSSSANYRCESESTVLLC